MFFTMAPLCADEAAKPNILMIVADDVGMGDLKSFYSAATTSTPNLDSLAAQGMRFSRFYTDSTCSASRAALLTGQNPARIGFHVVARGISSDTVTLAEWLHKQGYSTHHIGKWHVGELYAEAKPAAKGFDSSFGFMNQWFLQGPDEKGEPVLQRPIYQDPWLESESGEWRQYYGYLPDLLTDHAVKKIETLATQKQPWFLYYATLLPHGPLHAPPDMQGDVTGATDEQKYHAMLNHMDANIGAMLSALEKTGQRENTIIVFMSDNGAPEKREGSNAELGGGKASYSEGGIRAPLLWVDAKKTIPGSLDERAIYIADIFPTLAARIGAPLPFSTDGLDFNELANFVKIKTRQLFWLSRERYSVLSIDKFWRLTQGWTFRELNQLQLLEINSGQVIDKSERQWIYWKKVNALQKSAEDWMESISRTVVTMDRDEERGIKVSGADFLRTPLKEWDFYVAVSLPASAQYQQEQFIAEQVGIWSMSYLPQQKQLKVNMHGNEWLVPLELSDDCALLGLNADIYDKYTNLSQSIRPTQMRLSVNGKEKARIEWRIESLLHVSVTAPTGVGISASGDKKWQGFISEPNFYHRASFVGEWPFLIDEKALQGDLCSKLKH
jgi:arylsulfatase A-like enzyme